jgi:antitoxin component of MazEF toxin-antitoxin module
LTITDILGYPCLMKVLRVRRIGNSNMVSIPKELEAAGYTPGTEVILEEMPDGALRLVRAEAVSALIRDIGRQVIAEDREALEILAANDRSDTPSPTR